MLDIFPLTTCIFVTNMLYMQVSSHILMGIPHSASSLPLSALGEACIRRDLTAIHEILEKLGYKDDEGVANEVLLCSFSIVLFLARTLSFFSSFFFFFLGP